MVSHQSARRKFDKLPEIFTLLYREFPKYSLYFYKFTSAESSITTNPSVLLVASKKATFSCNIYIWHIFIYFILHLPQRSIVSIIQHSTLDQQEPQTLELSYSTFLPASHEKEAGNTFPLVFDMLYLCRSNMRFQYKFLSQKSP